MKSVVNITPAAREYINLRCNGTEKLLRASVNSKGCSGHMYEYALVGPETIGPADETITWPGGGLTIPARSVMYLIGSTLDVKSSMLEEFLFWSNPNAANQCGCGESFSFG